MSARARTMIALAMASTGITAPFSPSHRSAPEPAKIGARGRTCFPGNPPGSTDPELRAERRARRKRRMKLRKRRGWR